MTGDAGSSPTLPKQLLQWYPMVNKLSYKFHLNLHVVYVLQCGDRFTFNVLLITSSSIFVSLVVYVSYISLFWLFNVHLMGCLKYSGPYKKNLLQPNSTAVGSAELWFVWMSACYLYSASWQLGVNCDCVIPVKWSPVCVCRDAWSSSRWLVA